MIAALPPFAVAASGAFLIAMMLVRSTQMPTLDTGIQPLLVFVAPVVLGAIAGAVSKERARRLGFAAALAGAYLGLASAPAIFDIWLVGDLLLVIGVPGFVLGYALGCAIGAWALTKAHQERGG